MKWKVFIWALVVYENHEKVLVLLIGVQIEEKKLEKIYLFTKIGNHKENESKVRTSSISSEFR